MLRSTSIARGALALWLCALPLAADAQSATAPPALRTPSVMRVPTTFAASPQTVTPAAELAEETRVREQLRSDRSAQERAFVKKYGVGKPVTLRARRY